VKSLALALDVAIATAKAKTKKTRKHLPNVNKKFRLDSYELGGIHFFE